jgi:hypothetical protein
MEKVFKVAALLLIVTVGASAMQSQWITIEAQPTQSSGGCHEHGGKMPAPASYQCCLTGHNAAVLQIPYSPEPFHVFPIELAGEDSSHKSQAASSDKISVPAAGPPGSNPLRI